MDAREYLNRKGVPLDRDADRPNTLEEKAWERARGLGMSAPSRVPRMTGKSGSAIMVISHRMPMRSLRKSTRKPTAKRLLTSRVRQRRRPLSITALNTLPLNSQPRRRPAPSRPR